MVYMHYKQHWLWKLEADHVLKFTVKTVKKDAKSQ